MTEISRRKFLKTLVVGTTGLWVTSKLSPFSALGSVPWEERTESILIDESSPQFSLSKMFSPSKGIKNEYPSVDVEKNGEVWMCWTEETAKGEEIRLASFMNDTFSSPLSVGSPTTGFAVQPEMLVYDNTAVVVWTGFVKSGEWKVLAAIIKNGTVKKTMSVSETNGIA